VEVDEESEGVEEDEESEDEGVGVEDASVQFSNASSGLGILHATPPFTGSFVTAHVFIFFPLTQDPHSPYPSTQSEQLPKS